LLALREARLDPDLHAGAELQARVREGELKDYLFNKHVIHHLFCSTCGIESFARGTAPDGTETVAINLRCLDNIDIGALKPTPVDGRSL
jgi:hypothetical protein